MEMKMQKDGEGKKQTEENEAASGESCCRVPIGLNTSELSWRKPWDGLRDEGQDAGTSLYAGHLSIRRSSHPTAILSCIETHRPSLILPSLVCSFYTHRNSSSPRRRTIDRIASSCRHVGAYRFLDQSCASTTCLSSDSSSNLSLPVANLRLVERYLYRPSG